MSNDEEKEDQEEEVRQKEKERGTLFIFRAFRCVRRAILDFFGERDRRAGGCGVAYEFRAFCEIPVVSLVMTSR